MMAQRSLFDQPAPDTFGEAFTLESAQGVGKVSEGYPTPLLVKSPEEQVPFCGEVSGVGEIPRAGARVREKITRHPTPMPFSAPPPEAEVLEKVSGKGLKSPDTLPTPSDRLTAHGICRLNHRGLCSHSGLERRRGERGFLCCSDCKALGHMLAGQP